MRARSIWFVSSVAAFIAVVACNALTGAGDFQASAEDGGDGEPMEEAGSAAPVDANAGEEDASAPEPSCECVAEPAPGWTGPVALIGEDARESVPCPAGLSATMSGGTFPDVPEPGCEPCTCTLTGACTTVNVQTYQGSGCVSTSSCGSPGAATVGTACTPLTYCEQTSSVRVTSTSNDGSCTAAGGARRPAGWKRAVTACTFPDGADGGVAAPADAGCSSGLACAPKIAGMVAPTCIVHEGDAMCPDGPYSVRFTFGGAIEDTRTCSPCSCGAAQATCSGGVLTMYKDRSCDAGATEIVSPASCGTILVTTPFGSAKLTTPRTADGGCPPSGGVVTGGAVTTQLPWTACCLP